MVGRWDLEVVLGKFGEELEAIFAAQPIIGADEGAARGRLIVEDGADDGASKPRWW